MEQNRTIDSYLQTKLCPEELQKYSEPYFLKMCGFHKNAKQNKERIREAKLLRERTKERFLPEFWVSFYDSSVVKKDSFLFGEIRIPCKILSTLPKEEIVGVFLYAMGIREPRQKREDFLEQFYEDTWMTALLDGGRDWMKEAIRQKVEQENPGKKIFMTESFGPGYYGMGMEALKDLVALLPMEKVPVTWKKNTLYPPKSNIGIYLALSKEVRLPKTDCANCLSTGETCEFCKNYIPV